MNAKKKLTSLISLTLALCMLLSTAAMALESTGASSSDAGASSYTEPDPAQEPGQDADSSAEGDASGSAEPVEPSTEPTTEPDAGSGNTDPSPDVMAAGGWTTNSQGQYLYHYQDSAVTKLAGDGFTGENYQVLYLPRQTCSSGTGTVTFEAGFYYFQNGVWANSYTYATPVRYDDIPAVKQADGQYQVYGTYGYRLLTVEGGIGALYSGRFDGLRYRDGALFTGYALGFNSDAENLFYYYKGKYKTSTSKKKLTGYITFQGKLYYGSEKSLNDYKTSPKALPFTGRRTGEDGVRRRYLKGVPYEGLGLGTESTPNLYYYVEGAYQTAESRSYLQGNNGYHEYKDKLYHATADSLKKYRAMPYEGYRTIDGKLYKYTKGTGVLFTGRYTGEDGVRRRYSKGVRYNGYGLGTESTPRLYYYVDGDYQTAQSKEMVTGYHEYNGKTYYGNGETFNASLCNGYRTIDGKLYKYSKGVASLYTGVYKLYYYSQGVKQSKSGWVKVSGKTYYFKSGKAVTSWNYLSRYTSQKYKYYFKSDGTLVEDLFSYVGNSYLSKKMIVQVSRGTHTADILLWDSKTGSYCIAASSFVCSTCEKSSDFKTGTYSLYKNRRRRWFTFTHPDTQKTTYYQYATFIVGTDAWIHSPQYRAKNIRTLNVGNYNHLGTNQSYYCVRFQTRYSKRVYDAVGKQGDKKVKVKLTKSDAKGPFGKITLANSTGKLSKNQTYDPTDPAIKS
ncbi:MAG: hypothetical protein DBY10_01345 [Clostridiales bacterium]|nr:MAG: hypothetical protein DBY10_01345 [Clostridiales bacterium]